METLPADIRRLVAEKLKSPKDVMSFCETSKVLNEQICQSRDFWIRRLIIDYPEVYEPLMNRKLVDPKKTYEKTYHRYKEEIEKRLMKDFKGNEGFFGRYRIYERNLPEVIKTLENVYEDILKLKSSKVLMWNNPEVKLIYEKHFPGKQDLYSQFETVLTAPLEREVDRRVLRERLHL